MLYRCKKVVLDLPATGKTSALYIADKLMFVGSSTIAMQQFLDVCGTDLDLKLRNDFEARLEARNKHKNNHISS
jgi:hypothetical protein